MKAQRRSSCLCRKCGCAVPMASKLRASSSCARVDPKPVPTFRRRSFSLAAARSKWKCSVWSAIAARAEHGLERPACRLAYCVEKRSACFASPPALTSMRRPSARRNLRCRRRCRSACSESFSRAVARPADIGRRMADRRQFGPEPVFAAGLTTFCMKRAVERAMLQFRMASGPA